MKKVPVKQTVSFAIEAASIAAGERARSKQQLEQARDVAQSRKADILSLPDDDARKALRADLLSAFLKDGAWSEGTCKVNATQWATVIHALASGFVWQAGVSNIQQAYKAIATKRPKAKTKPSLEAFKNDAPDASAHMAALPANERTAYAERMVVAVADTLRDGTQRNTLISAALAYALANPQAVLELAKADQTFKAARRHAA